MQQSNEIVEAGGGWRPQTHQMSTLHARLQEGWASQQSKLESAERRVAASEEQIHSLQTEVRQLASGVQRRESQIETDASALTALKAQRDQISTKNNAITESEKEQAAQRESIREGYILHLRESGQALHNEWRALTGGNVGDTVIDELMQCIGEIEASVDALASQPDAFAMLAVGMEHEVFSCFERVVGELRARTLGEEAGARPEDPKA